MEGTYNIKLLVYSDIHYHNYSNGITIYDCRDVEEEIQDQAIQQNCDIVLFGGDRFLSRNPSGFVREIADSTLVSLCSTKPYIALAGNHDRSTKYIDSSTVYYPKDIYAESFRQFDCIANVGTSVSGQLNVVGVPAGHIDQFKQQRSTIKQGASNIFNILMFHDMLNGSKYANGTTVSDCIDPSVLDLSGFQLVLGGDNHCPQDLNFNNTHGMYIGAPMAHNWGDANQKRGYWLIDLTYSNGKHISNITFIESSAPKFIKTSHTISKYDDVTKIVLDNGKKWAGNIVRLTFNGPADAINVLNIQDIKTSFVVNSGAKKLEVIANITDTDSNILKTVDLQKAQSDAQEWNDFVDYSKQSLTGLDINKIRKLGEEFINAIDNS